MKELKKHYTKREIERILKNNGYLLDRQSGSHKIYKNDKGNHIAIGTCKYNAIVFQRLIKENNLSVE